MAEQGQRWYPTTEQLKPENLERTIRQILTQHYALADKVSASGTVGAAGAAGAAAGSSSEKSTSSPTGTKFLGLNVVPIDTNTLADGSTLKFSKANGNFYFG